MSVTKSSKRMRTVRIAGAVLAAAFAILAASCAPQNQPATTPQQGGRPQGQPAPVSAGQVVAPTQASV
ncbi:MAG: hypothetical protein ACLP4W_07350 [Mycobacterium sp.]|uniref:hypothetical protein n=1 Tax=Mycobacterium sp. TaxID=1785 RepID=UPI003F96C349